jgi:hypothetical protein
MVKLICSAGSNDLVWECLTTDSVDEVTRGAAEVHNLRLRVKRLAYGLLQLAQFGPMKKEEDRGMSEEQLDYKAKHKADMPGTDPLGIREGKPPHAAVAETMSKVAAEAAAAVDDAIVKKREAYDVKKIEECIQNIKGAVMMGYPMGLPEWDVVRMNIENTEDLSGQEESKNVLDEDSCSLWFAGKQMMRDEIMSKYVGKNEKCIVKAKFTAKNAGAPQRPPAVDGDTQKKMMAYWHKKQEQQKALEEDDEDQYLNSAWANPKNYKNQMQGLSSGGIRFR